MLELLFHRTFNKNCYYLVFSASRNERYPSACNCTLCKYFLVLLSELVLSVTTNYLCPFSPPFFSVRDVESRRTSHQQQIGCLSSVGAGAAVIAGRCWHVPEPFGPTSPRTFSRLQRPVLDVATRASVQVEGSTDRAFICIFAAVYSHYLRYTCTCCSSISYKCRAFVNLHVIRWETMCCHPRRKMCQGIKPTTIKQCLSRFTYLQSI